MRVCLFFYKSLPFSEGMKKEKEIMKKSIVARILATITVLMLVTSSASAAAAHPVFKAENGQLVLVGTMEETAAKMPVASGTLVKQNARAIIDYSNTTDGYVMVKFTGTTNTRIKIQIAGPSYSTKKLIYTYDMKVGEWTVFPLTDGNGQYKVTVLENTSGTKYAQVLTESFQVAMRDQFAPFLQPSQRVSFDKAPNAVAKAAELIGNETDMDNLKKINKVYNFVASNFSYDHQLAATVKSGYLPVLDNTLATQKGICYDYAALMTGMLRSQNVPCKMVFGYVNGEYHAWVNVWNGSEWVRMDPTINPSAQFAKTLTYQEVYFF